MNETNNDIKIYPYLNVYAKFLSIIHSSVPRVLGRSKLSFFYVNAYIYKSEVRLWSD